MVWHLVIFVRKVSPNLEAQCTKKHAPSVGRATNRRPSKVDFNWWNHHFLDEHFSVIRRLCAEEWPILSQNRHVFKCRATMKDGQGVKRRLRPLFLTHHISSLSSYSSWTFWFHPNQTFENPRNDGSTNCSSTSWISKWRSMSCRWTKWWGAKHCKTDLLTAHWTGLDWSGRAFSIRIPWPEKK